MDKFSTIKERILQFIEFKGITKEEFYRKTEIASSNFKGTNLKSEIGGEKLVKISTIYPEINLDWLLMGIGEKEKTKNEEIVTIKNGNNFGNNFGNKPNVKKTLPFENSVIAEPQAVYSNNAREDYKKIGIPKIPIEAMAGFGTGSVQVMDYETGRYVIPEFEEINVDFIIPVKGSSMYPKYSSGDLVACKKLAISDIFFQWNKVYVLDTEQGAIIKRIKKSNEAESISLVSENPKYDPFDLHLSQVYAIALVVGVIRLE